MEKQLDDAPPYIILDDFLPPHDLNGLLDYTLSHEDDCVKTRVLSSMNPEGVENPEYRRSRALFEFGEYRDIVVGRLESSLERIFEELGRAPFCPRQFEARLVASNDDEYFRPHTDRNADLWPTRELTFSFYYYREPKAFSGGELRMYPVLIREILLGWPITTATIAPEQNRMVVFPSSTMHEVLPVRCPSHNFADSRFTVTGWIHR